MRIAHGEVVRGRPQYKGFSIDARLDRERQGAGKQGDLGVGNAAGGVQVVEGENRVLSQVNCGSIFKLDLYAAFVAGGQAEAGFEGQIGNRLLPCFAGGLFVLLATRNADIALDITDADDLRIGGIRIMLPQNGYGFLLQLFVGVAAQNFL